MITTNIYKTVIGLIIFTLAGLAGAQGQQTIPAPLTQEEIDAYSIRVSDTPSRDMPGYRKLERMLVLGASPANRAALEAAAPEIEFVTTAGFRADGLPPGPYDAVAGANSTTGAFLAAEGAAWVHAYSAGIDKITPIDWIAEQQPIMTNSSGTSAPAIAEHAITMMMMHARQMHRFRDNQLELKWNRS